MEVTIGNYKEGSTKTIAIWISPYDSKTQELSKEISDALKKMLHKLRQIWIRLVRLTMDECL